MPPRTKRIHASRRAGASEHVTSSEDPSDTEGRRPFSRAGVPWVCQPACPNGSAEIPGVVAFANIGMSATAMRGCNWQRKHRPQLLQTLQIMLMERQLLGISLGGIGSRDCPLTPEEQLEIEGLLHEAAECRLDIALVSGRKQFQIMWPQSSGETVVMWRPNIKVEGCTDGSMEWFRVWLTNEVSLLIFSLHTPFEDLSSRRGCMNIIRAGVSEHHTERTNIGFVAGGCYEQKAWRAAALKDLRWTAFFAPMWFVHARPHSAENGRGVKKNDCYAVMRTDILKVNSKKRPEEERNTSHDVVFVDFSYKDNTGYKCPHCDRRDRGGYTWEPIGYPICTSGGASCFKKAVRRCWYTRELVQKAKYQPIFQKGSFKHEQLIGAVFKSQLGDQIFALL